MGFFDKLAIKKYMKEADKVLAYESQMAALSDDELRNRDSLYDHYKSIVNERYPNLTWGLTWE